MRWFQSWNGNGSNSICSVAHVVTTYLLIMTLYPKGKVRRGVDERRSQRVPQSFVTLLRISMTLRFLKWAASGSTHLDLVI